MKKKVLIIEDDKFLTKEYSNVLRLEGFDVLLAFDGEEGLKKIREEKPDLILLDLMLPKKEGFRVLEEYKNDPKLRDIPTIIITNLGQKADIEKGISLGVKDYFVKTDTTTEKLRDKIKEILGS